MTNTTIGYIQHVKCHGGDRRLASCKFCEEEA